MKYSMVGLSLRWTLAVVLGFMALLLVGCGGGGGSSPSNSTAATPSTTVNATATLEVSPALPEEVSPGSISLHRVYAINSQGVKTDVTASVQLVSGSDGHVVADMQGDQLRLKYGHAYGRFQLTLQGPNATGPVSKTVWITTLANLPNATLAMLVGEGTSSLIKEYGTDHYVSVPGRQLLVQVAERHSQQQNDVTREVLLTSSDPNVLSLVPTYDGGGNVSFYTAFVLAPGTVQLTAQIAGHTTIERFDIAPALVLGAASATAVGLTENPLGRLTAYFLLSDNANDLADRTVYFSNSQHGNSWSELTELTLPSSQTLRIISGVKVAESANGYRAVAQVSSLGSAWVHLIGADGTPSQPLMLATDLGVMGAVSAVSVTSNGSAHVWLFKPGGEIRHYFVSAVDHAVTLVKTVAAPGLVTSARLSVSVAQSGGVGITWDRVCDLNFQFDSVDLSAANSAQLASGVVSLNGCDASYGVAGFSAATGSGGIAVVVRVQTDFVKSDVRLINITSSGSSRSDVLDQDVGTSTYSKPQIGMDATGALVALWQTTDRGVWAVYQSASAALGASFQVEPPFFTLATPAVEGVHPRGDGRFLLAWTGGASGTRNRLEFRDYSVAAGLSERQSMPYEVLSATNQTYLLATNFGVSANWSYSPGIGSEVVAALQAFLP